MTLTSIDDLTDEIIGQKNTPERDIFENDLRIDIIGSLIREAREKRNMTQGELGELLGIHKAQISKLENNTKDVKIGTIIRVLEALNAKIKLSVVMESNEELIVT